ncbi:hypothetical protein [Hymenobacter cellulosilyticus]|uniref:Uncharacterized protein n=1 Tax=Hymenobacter cellulosilyticus TaxID=2932248 RepID=A0A8T9Q6D0_9BACT|nr:hypothetical protein [Hymenobacter cellulosilyticus]UOQ73186.1 hypothetical protein MUN79_04230 [Hymenobacter cellulosilyticus]
MFSLFRQRLPFLNIWLAAAAWTANYFVQMFCQPVVWAGLALVAAVGAFLAWPWLTHTPELVRYGAVFLQGLAFTVCCYCVLFLQPATLVWTLLMGFLLFPLLSWVPVLFGLQILWRIGRSPLRGAWLVGLLGATVLLPVQLWFYREYQAIEGIATKLAHQHQLTTHNLAQVLPQTYVAERIVGMHFRYHTQVEFYDGWRPPLHDPLLGFSYFLRNHQDPLAVGPGEVNRVQLYRALFPDRPIKPNCLCAYGYDGKTYRKWDPAL